MVFTRRDPLFEIRRTHRLVNRRWAGFSDNSKWNGWSIPVDIFRDGDNVTVIADVPGVKPENIDVAIENGVLSIKANTEIEEQREDSDYVVQERKSGLFHRSLRLSEHVDTENVELRYDGGILTITLPVAESKKAKHLKVAVGTGLAEGK